MKTLTKMESDANKVEDALRKVGLGFSIDKEIGYVAFELEDYEGTKIVVDGVGISVTEYGSEEFYATFSTDSLIMAISVIES